MNFRNLEIFCIVGKIDNYIGYSYDTSRNNFEDKIKSYSDDIWLGTFRKKNQILYPLLCSTKCFYLSVCEFSGHDHLPALFHYHSFSLTCDVFLYSCKLYTSDAADD